MSGQRENNFYAVGKAVIASYLDMGKPGAMPACVGCGETLQFPGHCICCDSPMCTRCQLCLAACPVCQKKPGLELSFQEWIALQSNSSGM
jgi:ferredoxin